MQPNNCVPSGYEKSPDYGGRPPLNWRRVALAAAIVVLWCFCLWALSSYANSEEFHGYDCTDDCSGHEAGYDWANRHGITNPNDCGGNSQSFIEGCEAYANEHQDDYNADQSLDNNDATDSDGN